MTSIGLDIGSRAIKLVELEKTRTGIRIVRAGIRLIPYHEKESEPERFENVTKILSEFLKELKLQPKNLNLSVSGQSVFIRTIRVIALGREKLHQHIRFEAEQQIPFALAEILWDYYIMGQGKKGRKEDRKSGEWKVILAAIKRNLVNRQLELVQKAGTGSELIDVGPIALYNCASLLEPELLEQTVAMVDIGAKATNLVMTASGDVWVRSFPLGSDRLTQMIQEGLHLDFNEAEVFKQRVGLEVSNDPVEKQSAEVIQSSLGDLIAEIERSLEYYSTQTGSSGAQERLKIQKVLLSGGGALLKGIVPFFQSKLGISIELWKGLQKIPSASALPKVEQIQFAVATGLALRGVERAPIELNLVRHQVVEHLKKTTLKWYGTGTVLCMIGIFAIIAGLVRSEYQTTKAYVGALKKTIQQYQTYEPKIKEIEVQNSLLKNQVRALYKVVQQRGTWLDTFKVLSKLLPKEVWITAAEGGIDFTPESVESTTGILRLVGRSLSYQGVTDFVSSLKSSSAFSQVKPVASSIKKTETGEEIVEFQVEMRITGK